MLYPDFQTSVDFSYHLEPFQKNINFDHFSRKPHSLSAKHLCSVENSLGNANITILWIYILLTIWTFYISALNSTPPPLKRLDLDRESMINEGPPKMPKLEVESPEIIQTLKDVESDDEILIDDDEDDDEAVAAAVADAVQGQLRYQTSQLLFLN